MRDNMSSVMKNQRYMKPSWEDDTRRTKVHSPEGVRELRKNVRFGLRRLYYGLAENMWRWELPEECTEMVRMSRGLVPEKYLMGNGKCVWFRLDTGDVHCLPVTMDSAGINMYGEMTSWHPQPVGWTEMDRGKNPAVDEIAEMKLNLENSVIMRNDLFGAGDKAYIDSMVDELVDNVLTVNQLQLMAKCPFIFHVTEDNLLTAKNFFLSMANDEPVIYTNKLGDEVKEFLESTNVKIDPALFEIFDRWECMILEYLGFPCVPITKRAQQTVSEVQSNDSKLYVRRMEKLRMRKLACEDIGRVFGVSVNVVSVIDEIAEQAEKDAEGVEGDE